MQVKLGSLVWILEKRERSPIHGKSCNGVMGTMEVSMQPYFSRAFPICSGQGNWCLYLPRVFPFYPWK